MKKDDVVVAAGVLTETAKFKSFTYLHASFAINEYVVVFIPSLIPQDFVICFTLCSVGNVQCVQCVQCEVCDRAALGDSKMYVCGDINKIINIEFTLLLELFLNVYYDDVLIGSCHPPCNSKLKNCISA